MIINNGFKVWQRGDLMGSHFIKREEFKVETVRLDRKHKGKYRYKAQAYSKLYFEEDKNEPGTTSFSYQVKQRDPYYRSEWVYSKTKHGAKVTALTNLLQKCRPPLSKQMKLKNKQLKKKKEKEIQRTVVIEVRVSNSFDFIMNDDGKNKDWHEIRKIY